MGRLWGGLEGGNAGERGVLDVRAGAGLRGQTKSARMHVYRFNQGGEDDERGVATRYTDGRIGSQPRNQSINQSSMMENDQNTYTRPIQKHPQPPYPSIHPLMTHPSNKVEKIWRNGDDLRGHGRQYWRVATSRVQRVEDYM